jgi:Na+-translocating ferredoxin:NAD+ oxidoreductase RnfC subunit
VPQPETDWFAEAPIELSEMIHEVQREAQKRREAYARLVAEHRMNRRTASRRIAVMDEIAALLERQAESKRQEGDAADREQAIDYASQKMIEAGAKAAYGTVFIDEENWPDISGSVSADMFRQAAKNCYRAMLRARR